MPTYDYVCDGCSHSFDEFQGINDKPLKKCPKCGKPKLRRLFGTGSGIVFKGSGFYATDYRSSAYKSAAQAEANAAKSASSNDNGTSGSSAAESSGASSEKKAK
jgi:putative FmdB family regulatory protein